MELLFIRHGQGEHTLHLPSSLHTFNPGLTPEGMKQAKLLRKQFLLVDDDLLLVSPLKRTLQTAKIWSEGIHCTKMVTPFVSPRIFPPKPNSKTLPCDEIMSLEDIKREYPSYILDEQLPLSLWTNGINTVSENEFYHLADSFLNWCAEQNKKRIYIVSHDGTMASYRQYITGELLSRDDFPKETGWFKLSY